MAMLLNYKQGPDAQRRPGATHFGRWSFSRAVTVMVLVVAIGLLCGLAAVLVGCGGDDGTTTTAPAADTTQATTGEPSETTAAGPAQTVRLGYLGWLTGIQGTQFYDTVKAYIAMVNSQGGIDIGGQQYAVELLEYDTTNDQNTAVAGANKLIYEDEIHFIAADSFVEAFSADAEENKVIISGKSLIPPQLTPEFNYLFNTGFSNSESAVGMRWFVENYPDKKHIMLILPDMELGHIISDINAQVCRTYDMEVSQEFYMLGNPDMSSLGTKVKTTNPDVVCLFEMTPLRAIREAGWTGQFFSVATNSVETLLATASAADIEGFIGTAYPTEFDPALTDMAQQFKDAYVATFGKWDNPAPSDTALLSALVAGMAQAGSTDPEKVAEVMASGMAWDSPCGPLMMVARPDVGNTRTVDSVNTIYMKQIVDGKAVLLDTVDLDTAAEWFADYLDKSAPAAH
ncbi:MAG: ABC transporter substrate-binding protein [Armatimonadetes bacterium]|nr:ABC transporter substrate-binding protein [Armatimonadota bacterium]